MKTTPEQLAAYCNALNELAPHNIHTATVGDRYARIVATANNDHDWKAQRAHSFVDMTTGDILKCGGWKAPAKNGVRGHITSPTACIYPAGHPYAGSIIARR